MISCCLVQMENGCIRNSTYPGGCALPNGNGSAPPTVQMHSPETLSSLSDPPTTGFYLWPFDQKQSCSRTLLTARNTQWLEQPYTSRDWWWSWLNVGLYVFLSFLICIFFLFESGRWLLCCISSHIIIWVLCLQKCSQACSVEFILNNTER